MKQLILKLLTLYKKYLSPGNFGMKICVYEPCCSRYAYQAIDKYGVVKGSLMALYRILRCNPFSKGGYDPVK
jgi:putative membrane protein insertion efficiency factor